MACVEEAAQLGIRRVFALTYRPGFFEPLGFRTLDKRELPQKIWKDCIRCANFTCCDEVALIRDAGPPARGEPAWQDPADGVMTDVRTVQGGRMARGRT